MAYHGDMTRCITNLISDEPANEDAFGGAYQRAASAIAELVRTESSGAKTIGLEGSWGTGKSTIVRLVDAELSNDPNCALWVFDAWAHQGDPLRRTFLEDLITE